MARLRARRHAGTVRENQRLGRAQFGHRPGTARTDRGCAHMQDGRLYASGWLGHGPARNGSWTLPALPLSAVRVGARLQWRCSEVSRTFHKPVRSAAVISARDFSVSKSNRRPSKENNRRPGPLALSLPNGASQLHDLPLHRLASHHAHEVRAPALQRTAAFFEILRPIVGAGDPGLVPAGMTQERLDNM